MHSMRDVLLAIVDVADPAVAVTIDSRLGSSDDIAATHANNHDTRDLHLLVDDLSKTYRNG